MTVADRRAAAAQADPQPADLQPQVDFDTHPSRYRHWQLEVDGGVARLSLNVDEQGGLVPGYDLKLNSYDLGVDIELHDAAQRLRFEYPQVRAVIVTSAKERMFCAGANIRMLAQSPHAWKVNFCRFTNETRAAIEDASACSGQTWIAALNGASAGGGYELALACDEIVLVDDGSSAVSLPEVPLLGVLPATGGLTRLVDKRGVRRDIADVLATKAEGVCGDTARQWGRVAAVAAYDEFMLAHRDDWLASEILHFYKRTLKRLDVTSRTLFASIEPGSCFTGSLAELALAADRSYMLDGQRRQDSDTGRPPATLQLTGMNMGPLPMANGLSRLASRFWGREAELAAARRLAGVPLQAAHAAAAGLVTFTFDDIDWD